VGRGIAGRLIRRIDRLDRNFRFAVFLIDLKHAPARRRDHGRRGIERSIEMGSQYHSDTPWIAPLFTVPQPAKAARREKSAPPAFFVWLDRYFSQTPEERMQDEYISYWN
jgi:hypothetical protein